MKRDIESHQDIECVVDAFYGGITDDPLLGPYFAAIDLEAHLPRMYAFWSSVLFQTGTYHGRPFHSHLRLEGLEPRHFERWLQRFTRTVDARYQGEVAERMKGKARQIAAIFQAKLGLLESA